MGVIHGDGMEIIAMTHNPEPGTRNPIIQLEPVCSS